MTRTSAIIAFLSAAIVSVADAAAGGIGRPDRSESIPNGVEGRRRGRPALSRTTINAYIDDKGNVQNIPLRSRPSSRMSRRSLQTESSTAPLSNVTQPPISRTQCSTSVRSTILEDYDPVVEPMPPLAEGFVEAGEETSSADGVDGEDVPPLQVSVFFTYYHTKQVSTVEGTAENFFGLHMLWYDSRLAWDPDDHGGCEAVMFRASLDAEKTEIWVPDFDLLNRVSGVQALPDAMAVVVSSGVVYWQRLGGLEAFCEFTGLQRFPYDTLGCQFLFGTTSWWLPIEYVMHEVEEDDNTTAVGMNISNHMSHFQEYTIIPDRATIEYCDPDECSMFLQFYWERAITYYEQLIVIPTIIFTILSFGMFMLDVRVGERLAFGVSLLLVIVANGILTSGTLPVCKERLWVQALTRASTYFVFAAQIESIIIAYLFFADKNEEEEKHKNEEEEKHARENCKEEEEDISPKDGGGRGSCEPAEQVGHSHGANDRTGRSREQSSNSFMVDDEHTKREEQQRRKKYQTLKQLLRGNVPSESWRLSVIRRLDRVSLILFPVTYIIFFSTMLARRYTW